MPHSRYLTNTYTHVWVFFCALVDPKFRLMEHLLRMATIRRTEVSFFSETIVCASRTTKRTLQTQSNNCYIMQAGTL